MIISISRFLCYSCGSFLSENSRKHLQTIHINRNLRASYFYSKFHQVNFIVWLMSHLRIFVCLFCCWISYTAFAQSTNSRDKILVIHSYHQGLLWTDDITKGIQEAFKDHNDIELHFEYLDSKRNTDSLYFSALYELYRVKLHNIPYKAIIVSDNNALAFVKKYRKEFFADIPLVFCAIDQFTPDLIKGLDNITGVTEEIDFRKTVELILRFHPQMDTLIVVNDNTTVSAIINGNYIKSFWQDLGTSVKYRFVENVSLSDLKRSLQKLDKGHVILLTNFSRDDKGQFISYQENIEQIKQATTLPVYSGWDFYLGRGIVGGMLTSGFEQGRLAAVKALKIISGTPVDSLPITREGYNHYAFDYEQLVRYNLPVELLPEGCIIINEPPGFYQKYKGILWISAALILFFTLLIIRNEYRNRQRAYRLMLVNKELDQRVAEKTQELQKTNAHLTEQKDKVAKQNKELDRHRNHLVDLVEAKTADLQKANFDLENARRRLLKMLDVSSDGVWEYNIANATFTMSEQTWQRLDYSEPNHITSLAEIDALIHPEDIKQVQENREAYLADPNRQYHVKFRIKNNKGKWHWLLSRGKALDISQDGKPEILVGTHIDVTERKRAEVQLKQEQMLLQASERKWRALYEQASQEILMLDLQGVITDVNPAACQWLGYSRSELLGANLSLCDRDMTEAQLQLTYLNKLTPENSSCTFDTFQQRKSGDSFPVEINVQLIDFDGGRFLLAFVRDMSRRQEVERQVLNAIIRTEENERSRFARDMHDSIGPLLSSLKLYLKSLEKAQSLERKKQVANLAQLALDEAITSIRQISTNLSPQILADYGFVSALRSFLQRLEAGNLVATSLDEDLGENRLPKTIELALYRISTELINNTLKHAHAKHIQITLSDKSDTFIMCYQDDGKGISGDNGKISGLGMGFSNIESRLKSIEGSWFWKAPIDAGFQATIKVPKKR